MVSSPSSKISFYDETGKKVAVPVEGCEYGIVIHIPKELLAKISLKLDAGTLQVRADEVSAHVYSFWPAKNPGNYNLSLACGDIREHQTITVVPQHFSKAEFTTMLDELTNILPKAITANLARCGAQLNIDQSDVQRSTIEDEWHKLHLAIVGTKEKPGLLQVLPTLQRECNKILAPKLEVRTINKMKRPEISRLPEAMSMPGNMISEEELYQMFDTTFAESFETYENQLTKTYVEALRSQLSRLQAKIKKEGAPPEVAAGVESLANEFHLAYVRTPFLRDVRKSTISTVRVTMVLLKNPAYRSVLEGYLALNQQSTTRLEEQALSAPLDNFRSIYRLWLTLNVFNALAKTCAESGYQCMSHNWVKSYKRGAFVQVVNDGVEAVHFTHPTTGTQVSLVPWRPVQTASNLEESMTLILAVETPGKPLSVLLFCPKYGVNPDSTAPRKEDIDELLRSVELLKGEQAVQYAALLYPGPSVQLAPSVYAVSTHAVEGSLLQQNFYSVIKGFL